MADKTDSEKLNEKLDKISAHMDSLHSRMDSWDEERKSDKARLDAACSSMDKSRADAEEKAKKDAAEAEEKTKADAAKKDADEKEEKERTDKARCDAEAKEKEEKESKDRADAAARADAGKVLSDAAIARIAALEKRQTAELSEDDKPKFAEVQMRCDAAYQAWGKQAPPALSGESVKDYSVRLLSELKHHSKIYKGSNLAILAGDESAFSVVQDAIIKDSIEASSGSVTVGAPLQKRVTKSDTGHVLTKWVGDPAVAWGPFMGGATKFGRINLDMANKR